MTAPVQEPTQGRTTSGLGYGQRQLFRRPAPVGGDSTIPGFHAYMTENLTLVSGTDGRLEFDFWINDDDTIFDAGTLSGGDLTDVVLLVDGWYSVDVWAGWTTAPASGFAGIMMIHDDVDIFAPSEAQGMTYPVNFHLDVVMKFTKVAYFPPEFLVTGTTQVGDRLEFWAVQNSGVNRTITWAYMVIGYLGERRSTPVS